MVVVCYTASFVVLSWALRGIDLSTAYAVWSGVGTALVAAIGIVVVWRGRHGIWKLACLALIVIGVAGLNLAGRRRGCLATRLCEGRRRIPVSLPAPRRSRERRQADG